MEELSEVDLFIAKELYKSVSNDIMNAEKEMQEIQEKLMYINPESPAFFLVNEALQQVNRTILEGKEMLEKLSTLFDVNEEVEAAEVVEDNEEEKDE